MLKVDHISASGTPRDAMVSKTGGTSQAPVSMWAPMPGGRTLRQIPGQPATGDVGRGPHPATLYRSQDSR